MVEVDERHAAGHVPVPSAHKEQPDEEGLTKESILQGLSQASMTKSKPKNTVWTMTNSNNAMQSDMQYSIFNHLQSNLDEAKIPPLTAPKVEQATKKGISQRKADPNNLLANVWNGK